MLISFLKLFHRVAHPKALQHSPFYNLWKDNNGERVIAESQLNNSTLYTKNSVAL